MSIASSSLRERAGELHARSIVIDALDVSRFDEAHFRKMQQGGITAANATVVMPGRDFRQTVEGIRDFDLLVERHGNLVMPVRSLHDVAAAKATGRVGLIYGLQNAVAVEGDLRLVKVLHSLGVRIIQLTYMTANAVGDGCLEPRNGGLTVFGRAVVRELNRTGILIDLSHVGERTSLDTIATSETPAAFTHACARPVVDNPRNKSDEVLRALAARGGVVGITAVPNYVCDFSAGVVPTLDHYLRQVDYVVNLVGADHVGIGMDYTDGHGPNFSHTPAWGGTQAQADRRPIGRAVWPMPYALPDSSRLAEVTEGLLARGYTEEDVRRILGENWLRLLRQVWHA
ncbi:MAG: membrane dipeptidase [Chloroflexi bacterium]|nr:membrane dipeptidase [Chloroflexota bacterium]